LFFVLVFLLLILFATFEFVRNVSISSLLDSTEFQQNSFEDEKWAPWIDEFNIEKRLIMLPRVGRRR